MSAKLFVVLVSVAVWSNALVTGQETGLPPVEDLSAADVAAQHKAVVLHVLQQRATSVPAENSAAVAAVLAEAEQQLEACAAALELHQQVWQYKVCASVVQRQGLASLQALQATAGAS
ncbi:uncharacterized protein LOC131213688 [Anopheles bellator]|uniref:uncharacterized protein LOC131213688 n=1 Tax=Anopheles bellator TaxID=139047 RepID=UPI00264A4AF1|nr:uncharacterized protein LOC131213688 [Anopheles bellator]